MEEHATDSTYFIYLFIGLLFYTVLRLSMGEIHHHLQVARLLSQYNQTSSQQELDLNSW